MTTKPMRVDGADISHHQKSVNLPVAKKAGLKFLYHKATEGATVKDALYSTRRSMAKAAGLPFGAYHFASPDGGDAVQEARAFLAFARPKVGDLLPCLDFEVMGRLKTQAQAMAWAKQFADVIRKDLGVWPVLYGPWDLTPGPAVRWIPRYNNDNKPPAESGWDIWQFSNGVLGVPHTYPGLGNVDLNTFAKGMSMGRLVIQPKQPHATMDVLMAHFSMQFSDSTAQKAQDVKRILAWGKQRGVRWITGTEGGAGSMDLIAELRKQAPAAGYKFWSDPSTDVWYLVQQSFMKGDWSTYSGPVIIPGESKKHTAKRVTSVTFQSPIGKVTVMAGHYLTKGRPGSGPQSANLKQNQAYAKAIGEHAVKMGQHAALSFYNGDQNIVDRTEDTFFGQPLTSCWDELKRWDNTGHGNIDVIASYDNDGRVVCKGANALDDKEFPLNTDHFGVVARYSVRLP